MKYILPFLCLGLMASGWADESRFKPVAASLILPGTGEAMLGYRGKAYFFWGVDALGWLSYAGFRWFGSSRAEDASGFASLYAGANPKNRSEDYLRALERYDDSDAYNEDVLRQARQRYPNSPDSQRIYLESHGYFGDDGWEWGSDSLRYEYWGLRSSSRTAYQRASFIFGGLLVNRLVSAVDCAIFSGKGRLGFELQIEPPGAALVYRYW
jgi:hypothetical protein